MARSGLYLGTQVSDGRELVISPSELTTHALCVGMTGSGKTGLCSVLLEEVLRGGVPVIAVDPKGDLGNLLLPLDPGDPAAFRCWIDPDAARREGRSLDELAAQAAQRATDGLAAGGLSRQDVLAWRAGHDARIYTPGSSAGISVDVIGSLAPPVGANAEELDSQVDASLRAILGLLRIEADPVRSREYILLFQLLQGAWREGRALTLADLVRLAADPPFDAVGALPLETFFPTRERGALVLGLNGLLASPPFQAWRTGEPLDIATMLRAPDGRPRLSIFSTAHLEDDERLFATALLLERVKSWVRAQSGTSDLRAVLYLDEIHGYFPPHPYNPATKAPLLTLLKQARAFGLGVVLATQNPVDLDYKGLSNIGTWFVGRLQTDQDKERIRDGLTGAAAAAGQTFADMDKLLAGVEKRVFLHHSIHRGAPALLKSRWAYSFLRGPLSREELGRLARPAPAPVAEPAFLAGPGGATSGAGSPGSPALASSTPGSSTAGSSTPAVSASAPVASVAAALPPAVPIRVSSPVASPVAGVDPALGPLYLGGSGPAQPHLLVKAAVRYKVGRISTDEEVRTLAFPLAGASSPGEALEAAPRELGDAVLSELAPPGLLPAAGPAWLPEAKPAQLLRVVKARLPGKLEATLLLDEAGKLLASPGESREAFCLRVAATRRSGKSGTALLGKLAKKQRDLAAANEALEGRKLEKVASVAGAVFDNLGMVFGKKPKLGGVGSVLSKNRMEDAAEARVEALSAEVQALEQQLAALTSVDPATLAEQRITPGAKELSILRVAVVYLT